MKKFFCTILIIFLFVTCSFAEEKSKVGVLAQLNMTEEDYRDFVLKGREDVGWHFLSNEDETFHYYDSLLEMQLALNAGEINEVQLPEIVGEYFVNSNPSAYKVTCVTQVRTTYLAFGFLKSNEELRKKINDALAVLREEGKLEQFRLNYIENMKNFEHVKFEKFADAPTIKIALTGDLPPIDFIDPDGTPAGFNVAILAEIGKKLKINIELSSIDAGARSSALASRRADAVFWYKGTKDVEIQPDIPDGVILSEPYYEWSKFIHIKKAKN